MVGEGRRNSEGTESAKGKQDNNNNEIILIECGAWIHLAGDIQVWTVQTRIT